MKTQTNTIEGTETVLARETPIPGLVITGYRGGYTITHVASGHRVCWASVYNYNATLEQIRNAMLAASSIDVASSAIIDWTVDADQLPTHQCSDWVSAFGGFLAHM